jgi:hypothetical protein
LDKDELKNTSLEEDDAEDTELQSKEEVKLILVGGKGHQKEQAGMSCAQPQAEAVSLEQKSNFLLKIYLRTAVADIFPLSLGFKF